MCLPVSYTDFCNFYWNNIKRTSLHVHVVAAREYPNVQSDLELPSVVTLKRPSLWNEIEIIFETCAKYLLIRGSRVGTTITLGIFYIIKLNSGNLMFE